MHRPLVYVYAEPSHTLMDIKDGEESLLDVEYSKKQLYVNRRSSLFFVFLMTPMALIFVVMSVYEITKQLKHNKPRI